mgnify:FL=1
MNENAIVEYEEKPLTISELKGQVNLIQQVMKEVMVRGEHYGVIPGCGDKPALLKPGAEKLIFTFRLVPDPLEDIIELPNEHREYRYKIKLYTKHGVYLGAGVGSCSTMESKYRYRKADLLCPECEQAAIIKGKAEFGGGWLCYAKKGGCGKKWTDADNPFAGVSTDRVEHDNPADYYNCVTPDTKVLTRDLQWVPAGEIMSGDILVGVEENMTDQYARHMAIGEATVHGRKLDELYELTLEDGRVIKCNGEHKWLVKKIGLKGTEWVSTQDILREITERKGRPRNWSIMSVFFPWIEDTSKEAGYIAGLLDADGSLGSTQLSVLFAQQQNIILALIQNGLTVRGYQLGIDSVKTAESVEQSLSQKQVYQLRIRGGFAEQLRLLGSIRPPRLMERWLTFWDLSNRRLEGRGSGAGRPVKIISIEPIGMGEVVLLGTSCRTYLAEGLVCHNTCQKMAKKRALVDACLTVTAASDIFTQDIDEMAADGLVGGQGQEKSKSPTTQPQPQRKSEKQDENPFAEQEKSAGGLTITDIKVQTGTNAKTKKDWTKYAITASDGKIWSTFSDTIGKGATEAMKAGAIVSISGTEGSYGWELQELEIVQQGDSTPDTDDGWTKEKIIDILTSSDNLDTLKANWASLLPHISKLDGQGKADCQGAHDQTKRFIGEMK